MSVGGFNADTLNLVEILDLEDDASSCRLADFPVVIEYASITLMGDEVWACGGESYELDTVYSNRCYAYDPVNNSWRHSGDLSVPRNYPSSSLMGKGDSLLVAGGNLNAGSESTDVFSDGVFTPGPSLPFPIFFACQVGLNRTHVFLADGYDGNTFILDTEKLQWMVMVKNIVQV